MKNLNLSNISHRIPYFLFFIILLTTCSKDSPIEPIELQEANTRTFGKVTFTGEKILKIRNDFGGIILYGINQVDTIGYMLYKVVKAESQKIARDHFDNILLESYDENDTLYISISAPYFSDKLEYYCGLSLEVPYQMLCQIENATEGIYVFDLDSTLFINNAKNNIEIQSHKGSCEINTSKGNISIEIVLPDSGFCRCATSMGDIVMKLPVATSATVYAKSNDGIVGYNNLTFSSLGQETDFLSGTLGTGDGEIYLETQKGNIQILGF